MKITTLENVPMSEITAAFNEGFSDYLIKFTATEEYLTNRWRGGRVDLAYSAGGWMDEKLVALLVIGLDEWGGILTAFNTATCVAPDARGNNFTQRAYDFLMPKFDDIDVEQLTLEVIQKNERAIPVYEKVGFKIERRLNCYGGEPKIRFQPDIEGIKIELAHQIDLEKAVLFHDFDPAWENTFLALLLNWEQYEVFQLTEENQLLGYAIVHKETGNIPSFGIHPDHRRKGLATMLFSKINEKHPVLKINNVDDRDQGTLSFIDSILLPNPVNQYEMKKLM